VAAGQPLRVVRGRALGDGVQWLEGPQSFLKPAREGVDAEATHQREVAE